MQFIDLSKQYQHLKTKIDKRIQTVLDHGKYIMGPEVLELEEQLADYIGVKHAITCANGTDALTLSMMALDLKAGDAIFCPTFTFFATAETIALQGATPIFVDSDPITFNICPKHLEHQILKTLNDDNLVPKAIITVDLFGLPANYDAIQKVAIKFNLKLIEDAAQGFGGEIKGKRAGSFGDIATTSFFPAKPLGCYGDGGALFTDNDEYAELLKSYRVHGKGMDKYDNVCIGMNSRLDSIQAAVLLEKLNEFPTELESRNIVAETYKAHLDDAVQAPVVPANYLSSWAQYTVRVDCRDKIIRKCNELNVPVMIYYKTSMHQQTAFAGLDCNDGDFPVASSLSKEVLSLPMHPYLQTDDIIDVSHIINDLFDE